MYGDNIMDLRPGFHEAIPPERYHRKVEGIMSKGAADRILVSPAAYRAWLDEREKPEENRSSKALTFGKAAHVSLLEPARFEREYRVVPNFGDYRSSTNRDKRDAWKTEAIADGCRLFVEEEDLETMRGMASALTKHPLARTLLVDGIEEATIVWDETVDVVESVPIRCKARPDFWLKDLRYLVDFKTCENAGEGFRTSIRTHHYRRQHAHYMRGATAVGLEPVRFLFVAIEKSPPFDVVVWELDSEAVSQGNDDMTEAKFRLATAVESGIYPGYSDHICTAGLEPWEKRKRDA